MKTALVVLSTIGVALCRFERWDMGPPSWELNGGPYVRDYPPRGGCGGGMCGRFRRGPPPPPFLRNITGVARVEYFEIMRNWNITVAQQKQEVLAWARNNSIEGEVQQFFNETAELKNQLRLNVSAFIIDLQSAYAKLSSLTDNETQTPAQLHEAIRNLTAQDPKMYKVLRWIVRLHLPKPPRSRGPCRAYDGPCGFGRGSRGGVFDRRGYGPRGLRRDSYDDYSNVQVPPPQRNGRVGGGRTWEMFGGSRDSFDSRMDDGYDYE